MFIVSMKVTRRKIMIAIGIILVLVMGFIFLLTNRTAGGAAKANASVKDITIKSEQDIISFLQEFGWELDAEPLEVQQVSIPTEFNDVYQNYNAIQKKQGYNLEEYRGENVKRYSFCIKNYPNKPENIRANVLVYQNRIVGGDVNCIELDGFMHGFQAESAQT